MPRTWTGYGTGTPARCSWQSAANSALAHCPAIISRPAALPAAIARLARDSRTRRPSRYALSRWNIRCSAIAVPLGRQQAGPVRPGTPRRTRKTSASLPVFRMPSSVSTAARSVTSQRGRAAVRGPRRRGWSQVDQRSPAGRPATSSWASGGGQRPAVPVALGEDGLVVVKSPLAAAVGRIGHRRCSSGRAVKEGSVVCETGIIGVLLPLSRHRQRPGRAPATVSRPARAGQPDFRRPKMTGGPRDAPGTVPAVPENHFGEPIAAQYDAAESDRFEQAAIDRTVSFLAGLAGDGDALELGIGTGRIALPLQPAGRSRARDRPVRPPWSRGCGRSRARTTSA